MSEEIKNTTVVEEAVEAVTEDVAESIVQNVNETTGESKLEKAFDIWEQIRLWCHFVPIITTVGFLLSGVLPEPIFMTLAIIGWVATILTGPARIIRLTWKWFAFGWKAFYLIPIYPICLVLGGMGFCICFAVYLWLIGLFPAVITIYYFFTEEA